MVECTHEAGSIHPREERRIYLSRCACLTCSSPLLPFCRLYCSPPLLLNPSGCATLSCALHAWCVTLSPPLSPSLAGPAQYSPTLIQSLRHRPPSSHCSHDPHLLTHDTILHQWATQAVHVSVTSPSSVALSALSFWLSLARCSRES
jgi:hypothetical protein